MSIDNSARLTSHYAGACGRLVRGIAVSCRSCAREIILESFMPTLTIGPSLFVCSEVCYARAKKSATRSPEFREAAE